MKTKKKKQKPVKKKTFSVKRKTFSVGDGVVFLGNIYIVIKALSGDCCIIKNETEEIFVYWHSIKEVSKLELYSEINRTTNKLNFLSGIKK